jgi:hypothetical protein
MLIMSKGPGVLMRAILAELESTPDVTVAELARALDIRDWTADYRNLEAALRRLEARGAVELGNKWMPDPYWPNKRYLVPAVRLVSCDASQTA